MSNIHDHGVLIVAAISFTALIIAVFMPAIVQAITTAWTKFLDAIGLNPDRWPEMDSEGNWIDPEKYNNKEIRNPKTK